MTITCPHCRKQYLIEEENIPKVKSVARCKDCGGKIIIDPAAIPPEEEREEIAVTPETATTPVGKAEEDAAATAESGPEPDLEKLLAEFPWLDELNQDILDLGGIFKAETKKGYHTRRNRIAAAALKAVSGCLAAILKEEEKVLRAARGAAYIPAEIPYANTILTLPANRYTILCTSRRILLLNLDWRQKRCGEFFYQVPYGNIREIGRGAFRDGLIIKSRSGRQMRFTSLTVTLSREISEIALENRRHIPNWNVAPIMAEFLCPACFAPQSAQNSGCSQCSTPFKSPTTAFYRSLALAGLGAFYLNHRLLAAGEMTILGLIIVSLVLTITLKLVGGLIITICALLVYQSLSAMLTFILARKGLMADDRESQNKTVNDP